MTYLVPRTRTRIRGSILQVPQSHHSMEHKLTKIGTNNFSPLEKFINDAQMIIQSKI